MKRARQGAVFFRIPGTYIVPTTCCCGCCCCFHTNFMNCTHTFRGQGPWNPSFGGLSTNKRVTSSRHVNKLRRGHKASPNILGRNKNTYWYDVPGVNICQFVRKYREGFDIHLNVEIITIFPNTVLYPPFGRHHHEPTCEHELSQHTTTPLTVSSKC